MNPATNKIHAAYFLSDNVTVIDEAPIDDTKVWAVIDTLPNHTTTLARQSLTCKGVNRWLNNRTRIEGMLFGLNSAFERLRRNHPIPAFISLV